MSAAGKHAVGSSVRITLPSDRELALTREFDAPREMVFDALTKPELLKRWFGPPPRRRWSTTMCKAELRVGGAWRIAMRNAKGDELVLHGVYREFARPERIVTTQLIEGCPGQGTSEAVSTTVLTEMDGKTVFTNTVRYPSMEVRDSVLRSGGTTEAEMSAIYDKLAALLATGVQDS